MESGDDPRKYPVHLFARDSAAAARCRGSLGHDRTLIPPEAAMGELRRAGAAPAIVVVEHRDDLNAAALIARLAGLPHRDRLHVLVADPEERQGAFVAVDAGADDYVADRLDGEEFAFRVRAADGALSRIEDGTGLEREVARAEPLDAAELAPSREPRLLMAAAAREAGRLAGADVAFVFQYTDGVVRTLASWGAEKTAPGAVFEMLEVGCLPEVLVNEGPARINLTVRPLGREQSISSYIKPVYRSGLAVPLRLGTIIWGALLAGRTTTTPFDDRDEEALEGFADRVAVTVGIAERRGRLDLLAESDLETGLLKREVLERRFLQAAAAEGGEAGLALFRLDDLDDIRESSGASGAGHALHEVGRHLTRLIQAGDLLGRWSDDEIAWVLPGAGARLTGRSLANARELLDGRRLGASLDVRIASAGARGRYATARDLVREGRRRLPAPATA